MANRMQTGHWLLILTVARLLLQMQAQTFTEKEKDAIIGQHLKRLDQEALSLFETTLEESNGRSNLRIAMNYDGTYDMLALRNVSSYRMACSEHLGPLIGIDYKRHNDQHYLLCFSIDSLLIRTFKVHNKSLTFDPLYHSKRLDGQIRHALFYRHYNTDRLFVAALIQRGVFVINTFEVQRELAQRELSHQFYLGENVISIDYLHYGLDQHRLVALTDGNDIDVHRDGEIVKMSLPRASHLATLRIQRQGFIIGANATHWYAYSYTELGTEKVASYRSYSMIVDLKTMIYGNQYYVAVAAQFEQLIYKWSKDTFLGNAKMRQRDVYKMNALSVSYMRDDIFFYFDQHAQNITVMYGYDGNLRQFVKLAQLEHQYYNQFMVHFNPRYGSHFSQNGVAFELKVARDAQIHVFAHETAFEEKGKATIDFRFKDRMTYEHKIHHLNDFTDIQEKTETLSKKNINMSFSFTVKFQGIISTKRLEVHNPRRPDNWIVNTKHLHGNDLRLTHLHQLRHDIPLTVGQSRQLKDQLDRDVVFKSSSGQINGTKEFLDVIVPSIKANSASIDTFRGQPVSQVLYNLYRTGSNVPIRGTKTLDVDTTVSNYLNVDTLNKARVEDFFYADLQQDVYGDIWHRRLFVDQLHIDGPLAPNVSFSKAVFINQNGNPPVVIQNRVILNDMDVNNLHVDKIDNLMMNKLAGQVLRKNEKEQVQTFRMPMRIQTLDSRADVITEYLNNIPTANVFADLVLRNGPVHFHKPVRINGDARFHILNTDGKVNGIRIPEDLLDRNLNQVVQGEKKFNRISIKNLETVSLNGLRIPNDIITLSRDEYIPGHLSLDAFRVSGNLQVDGLVDGIKMAHLDERYIATLKNNFHNLTFYAPVHVKRLNVKGQANGLRIEETYNDCIFNDTLTVHIPSTKTITSMLRCDSLHADLVNGQNLKNFVTTKGRESFPNRVTFKELVQFSEVALSSTLDGVPINEIVASAQLLNGQNVIHGTKTFLEPVQVDNLIVKGAINRIHPNNFLLYGREQNITGNKAFKDARIGQLQGTHLNLTGHVNDRPVKPTLDSLIWLNQPRLLDTTLFCVNCSATQIETTYVNGKNFTYFLENVLTKSGVQTIRGNKKFNGIQQFGELKTLHGMVAGINMTKIHQEAITLRGHNIVRNPVIIHGNLIQRNGHLHADRFNGIDIKEYYQNAVHNNHSSLVQIHGTIIFGKGFDVHADLMATRVNNVPPEHLFLTSTGNYTIQSRVNFAGRVVTSGNVRVKGHVNGVDLALLDANILKVNQHGEVDGSVNFVQKVNVAEISVAGLVDGIPLNRQSILMANANQNIDRLVLNGPVHLQNLNVLASINGFQQDNLNKIVLAHSKNTQVINASKTFHHVDAVDIHQLRGDVHVKVINGVPLRHFAQNAVFANHSRVFKVRQHFRQNVTIPRVIVEGTVNNIDLLTEVIRLDNTNQMITGIKTFEHVNLNDDVTVHGYVNAHNLSQIKESVLFNVGPQTISNSMTFKAPLYLASDSRVDQINHFAPSHLLTLHGAQQVASGQLEFNQIRAEQISSRFVNHVNLTEMNEHVLRKNSPNPQWVQGNLLVNKVRFDDEVILQHHLNKVDLNVVVETAQANLNEKFDVKELALLIQNQTNTLYEQQKHYEYATFEIEYLQPSPFTMDNSIEAAKFDYIRHLKYGRKVFDAVHSLVHLKPNIAFQPIAGFDGQWFISIIESQADKLSLDIRRVTWDRHQQPILHAVYSEHFPLKHKVLAFQMDRSMYILSGITHQPDCRTDIQTNLKRLVFSPSGSLQLSNDPIQYFSEENVVNLGHFVDDYGTHYLVFNSQPVVGLPKQITIYRRLGPCLFELFQSIPAVNVQYMALFKFGIPNLVEQYLAVLSNNRLTLFKQEGILGFSQSWSIRASTNAVSITPHQLLPYIFHSQLHIYSPTCPGNVFEAILNGFFTNLQLSYDEYC